MTPRERVLTAIRHEKPDRTPCDFWAESPTWQRIFAHVGHTDREALLARLGVDMRHLEAPGPPDRQVGNGCLENSWGERFIMKATPWGPMREDTKGALAGAESLAELERFSWPTPDGIDHSSLRDQCRHLDTHALVYGFADVWQRPALVRGWQDWFLDLIEHPDWVHFLCRKFTDFYLEDYTRAAEVTCGRIDIYLLISDLGSQRGPLIPLDMFREFAAPYIKEMIDRIHHLGGYVLFHSCGAIAPLIPDLIALGVDILDPMQPVGPAMQPERLAADFGTRICFHGGIDMQRLLPAGSPMQIAAEVRRCCEVLGARGGYILGPAHRFQPDVPPENILAMYDALR